jgi:hypothetical protein
LIGFADSSARLTAAVSAMVSSPLQRNESADRGDHRPEQKRPIAGAESTSYQDDGMETMMQITDQQIL